MRLVPTVQYGDRTSRAWPSRCCRCTPPPGDSTEAGPAASEDCEGWSDWQQPAMRSTLWAERVNAASRFTRSGDQGPCETPQDDHVCRTVLAGSDWAPRMRFDFGEER